MFKEKPKIKSYFFFFLRINLCNNTVLTKLYEHQVYCIVDFHAAEQKIHIGNSYFYENN